MIWQLLDARTAKSRCDFIALVREYLPRLRPAGRQYRSLCPFHQERHPSFYVHPRGVWHCFGCGAGGDVFDFIMRIETCNFCHALEIVARFSGVARESEAREAGERFRARVGASPAAAKRPPLHSPQYSAALNESRTRAWEKTMRADFRKTSLPCEPFDEDAFGGIYTPTNNFQEGHRGRR
jgi:DNA primase